MKLIAQINKLLPYFKKPSDINSFDNIWKSLLECMKITETHDFSINKECGEIKQLREFYMSSQSHDGKTSACKKCADEKHKEREMSQQLLAEFYNQH